MNRSFLYGDGFFETLAWVSQGCELLPLHIHRARKTAEFLGMQWPDDWNEAYFQKIIQEETLKNGWNNSIVRITFFRKQGGTYQPQTAEIAYYLTTRKSNNTEVFLPQTLQQLINELSTKQSISAQIYSEYLKPSYSFSNYKLTSAAYYVKASLSLGKSDTLILLNDKKRVCEGLDSNVFIIMDNIVTTPPLTEGPVAGVYREYLLEKLNVSEEPITPDHLKQADHIFLTNAGRGIVPFKLI